MLKKMYALKNKKGFTLVELMVVVAILGILVAVAVPVYNSVTTKAEENTCAATRRTIESAVMQATVNGKAKAEINALTDLSAYLEDVENIKCPSAEKVTGKANLSIVDGEVYCAKHAAK